MVLLKKYVMLGCWGLVWDKQLGYSALAVVWHGMLVHGCSMPQCSLWILFGLPAWLWLTIPWECTLLYWGNFGRCWQRQCVRQWQICLSVSPLAALIYWDVI